MRHRDGGVGGPGGRLDGLPLRGRDDEDAVGGQVGVDSGGLAALNKGNSELTHGLSPILCKTNLGQRVLPAELAQNKLVVALLLVLRLHAQHAASNVHLKKYRNG